jgi:hypothetical protein
MPTGTYSLWLAGRFSPRLLGILPAGPPPRIPREPSFLDPLFLLKELPDRPEEGNLRRAEQDPYISGMMFDGASIMGIPFWQGIPAARADKSRRKVSPLKFSVKIP